MTNQERPSGSGDQHARWIEAKEQIALAQRLGRLGDFRQSLAAAKRVLSRYPQYGEAWLTMGAALNGLQDGSASLVAFKKAFELTGGILEAQFGMALALASLGRFGEVVGILRSLLARAPTHGGAWYALAIAERMLGHWNASLRTFDTTLRLYPGHRQALSQRALVHLTLGDFEKGFQDYEHRWSQWPNHQIRSEAPPWLGQGNLDGLSILLTYEQGLGDAIQFARYVPALAARGARVIVCVPAVLVPLLSSLLSSPSVIAEDIPTLPPHDLQCSLNSLPFLFRTRLESIPATTPYLFAFPPLAKQWGEQLGKTHALRVGIAWRGRNYLPFPDPRAVPLKGLLSIFNLEINYVVLQNDVTVEERRILSAFSNVDIVGPRIDDFGKVAAVVANLDLVVTVDTAFAHLAGAMNKPTWVMHRFAGDWRWLLERTDSPWYPSLRLIRQPTPDAWASVIEEVTAGLRDWLAR